MSAAGIVFDLYGTLLRIDGLRTAAAAAGVTDAAAFVDGWRAKQIEYAWCCTIAGDYRDFDELTRLALAYTARAHGAALDAAALAALADAWLALPAHDDAVPALERLAARGVPLLVLTNGVKASAERALRNAGIRRFFTDVLSTQAVRAYKPDARVYGLATAHLGCAAERNVFVSSNGWDAAGAAAFGFRVAFCNRAAKPRELLGAPPALEIASLSELDRRLDEALRIAAEEIREQRPVDDDQQRDDRREKQHDRAHDAPQSSHAPDIPQSAPFSRAGDGTILPRAAPAADEARGA